MTDVDVEVRTGRERARHVVERTDRHTRGVHGLDVPHGVRCVPQIWIDLDRAPRMRIHEAELHCVRVFGTKRGVATEHVARVLPVFGGTQLLRIGAAHATRVAHLHLTGVREPV